jgi:hypothetical protein
MRLCHRWQMAARANARPGHFFRKTRFGFALVAFATIGSSMTTARAAPALLSGLRDAADSLSLIEKTQFVFDGQEYCWYANGWNGPGWYLCGYDLRQGLGYGGPAGWHDWHPGRPPLHGPGSSHNPMPPPTSNQPVSPGPVITRHPGVPDPGSTIIYCGSPGSKKPGCPGSNTNHPPPPKNISKQGPPGSGLPPHPGGGSGAPTGRY